MKVKFLKYKKIIFFLFLVLGCVLLIPRQLINEHFDNKEKIGIVMWYDDNIKEYADMTAEINTLYCKKYNIDFITSYEKTYTDRKPHWERLPLLLKNLKKYDYLIWIDADAFFYKDAPNIIDIINKYKHFDFIFSKDICPPLAAGSTCETINTGIFIVKNTPYSLEFLKKWAYDKIIWNKRSSNEDQDSLIYMINSNILNINNDNHHIVLDFNVLQSFDLIQSSDKPYIMHMAGQNKKYRIDTISKYLQSLIT